MRGEGNRDVDGERAMMDRSRNEGWRDAMYIL
jgi:hypothetical protein